MPGYQDSELGFIPGTWERQRIRDAASKTANAIVGGPFGSDLVSADYTGSGVPVIRGRNMARMLVGGEFVFVSQHKARSLSANIAMPSDLVFTQRGTLGQVSLVPSGSFDCYLISQSQMKVSLDQSRHDPSFVQQYFLSRAGQKQILASAIQTGVPHTNLGILRAYHFPTPPLAEQRAIAAALSDVDALVEVLDRLIAKKRDLKQAAMQQLLTGQTRLPGFSGKWGLSLVGREFDIQLGKMLDAERNVGETKPYLGNKSVQWARIDVDDVKMMSIPESELERYRLRRGDLLVCEGGEVGRAAIWDAPIEDCYYQKALHRLRPTKGFSSPFMLVLLQHWTASNYLKDYVSQTSIAHLTREKFAQVPLQVPSPGEQAAISTVLGDFDSELAVLEQRREKTRLLKQGMMQELLTGRTRLA